MSDEMIVALRRISGLLDSAISAKDLTRSQDFVWKARSAVTAELEHAAPPPPDDKTNTLNMAAIELAITLDAALREFQWNGSEKGRLFRQRIEESLRLAGWPP